MLFKADNISINKVYKFVIQNGNTVFKSLNLLNKFALAKSACKLLSKINTGCFINLIKKPFIFTQKISLEIEVTATLYGINLNHKEKKTELTVNCSKLWSILSHRILSIFI